MIDWLGEFDPREMPEHLFWSAIRRDFDSAQKADICKQNYCSHPRCWYVDATFCCVRCKNEFCFTAAQQKHWYEELQFYVDSLPKHCLECRRQLRGLRDCRKLYDRDIATALQSNDIECKKLLIAVIDELCETGDAIPTSIAENRRILAKQLGHA